MENTFSGEKFLCFRINGLFSIIVISEAIGLRKPDPEIYLYTCNQLDCKPSDCIFIGDNPKADIEGAKNWYENNIFSSNSYPSSLSDASIHHYDELEETVRRLINPPHFNLIRTI